MPKNGFPMLTAKNRFQILNLHPKKHIFKKQKSKTNNMVQYNNNKGKNCPRLILQ